VLVFESNTSLGTAEDILMKAAPQSIAVYEPPSDAYRLDMQIGFRLRVALQQHTDIFFKTMDFGLTQPQFASLARLYETGPCSQNQLGRLAALDSASIVGVVNRLKARKFVTTAKSPDDRRRVIVDLTPEGRQVVRKAIRLGQKANDQTLSALTPSQRRQLIELLVTLAPTGAEE
jgi:MarR family transcriptional regulator, lower aerobic nicotinate degradation pathway regulator